MRRLAAAFVLVIGLASAPPTFAQHTAETAAVDELLSQYADYGRAHGQVISAATDLMEYIISSMSQAADLWERHASRADRQAWADRFNAGADSRIAILEQDQRNLPAIDGLLSRVLTMPELANQRRGLETMRQGQVLVVGAANDLLARVRVDIAEFVRGDDAAPIALAADLQLGMASNLEAENAVLEAGEIVAGEAHPARALVHAERCLNSALAQLFVYQAGAISGRAPPSAETRSRMLALVEEARSSARNMEPLATAMIRDLEAGRYGDIHAPGFNTVVSRARAAFATYPASAEVELRIADLVTAAAAHIGETDHDFSDDLTGLEDLVSRRVLLQEQRARAMLG